MADTAAFKQYLGRWARDVLDGAADDMVPRIKPYAPVKTGELRESIHRDRSPRGSTATSYTARIVATAPQGRYTDEGTKPHVIVPRRAGGLLVFHWPKAGGTVFLRRVNHPGNKARPWWKRSLTATWGPALRANAIRRTRR